MDAVDWKQLLEYFLLLVAAYVLTLPIGWDQEREHGAAGIRVFPFLGVGSCAYILLSYQVPEQTAESHARMLVGLMSGIGFLSGGAILKDKSGSSARGIATAASMWVTATVGAAVGLYQFNLAILVSAIVFLTHKLLRPMKKLAQGEHQAAGDESDDHPVRKNDRGAQDAPSTAYGTHDFFSAEPFLPPTGSDPAKPNAKETDPGRSSAAATAGAPASIMGVLVAYKDITVQGLPHRVGVIRDEKDAEYIVDLGPAEQLKNLTLTRGMYMMVQGWVSLIGNRQGLRATQVRYNGGVIDIAA